MMHYRDLFIGGQWTRPSSSEVFDSIDPYAGEAWATFPDCDLQDVDNAVAAAKSAFDDEFMAPGRLLALPPAALASRPIGA